MADGIVYVVTQAIFFSASYFFGVLIFFKKNIFLQRFSSVRVGTLVDHIVIKHSDLNLDIVAEKRELVQAHIRSSLLDLPAAFDTINQSIDTINQAASQNRFCSFRLWFSPGSIPVSQTAPSLCKSL